MSQDPNFGEIRSLTQLHPHATRFEQILELCVDRPDALLESTYIPYLQGALTNWPKHILEMPTTWLDAIEDQGREPILWPIFKHLHLVDLSVKALGKILKTLDLVEITHLTIERCTLGPKAGITKLIKALAQSGTQLESLTLHDCTIGSEGLETLLADASTAHLQRLTFIENGERSFPKRVSYQSKSIAAIFRDMPPRQDLTHFQWVHDRRARYKEQGYNYEWFPYKALPELEAFFATMPMLNHLSLNGFFLHDEAASTMFGQGLAQTRVTSLDLRRFEFRDLTFMDHWSPGASLTHLGWTPLNDVFLEAHPKQFDAFALFERVQGLTSLSLSPVPWSTFGKGRSTIRKLPQILQELTTKVTPHLERLELDFEHPSERPLLKDFITPEHFPRLTHLRFGDLLPNAPPKPRSWPSSYSHLIRALLAFPANHPLRHIDWQLAPNISSKVKLKFERRLEGMTGTHALQHQPDLNTLFAHYHTSNS